jgi:hypothetical protein
MRWFGHGGIIPAARGFVSRIQAASPLSRRLVRGCHAAALMDK